MSFLNATKKRGIHPFLHHYCPLFSSFSGIIRHVYIAKDIIALKSTVR